MPNFSQGLARDLFCLEWETEQKLSSSPHTFQHAFLCMVLPVLLECVTVMWGKDGARRLELLHD